MGLSYKQVSCEDGLDWGQNLFPSEAFNLPNPPQATQQQSTPLNCPRCNSTNTKFCYYNNYNRSQPRHFCKSCKRHWTKGGTLRNVPVGGGRKNKKHKTSKTSAMNSHGSNLKNVNEIPSQTLFNSSSTSSSSSGLQVNYVNNEVDKFEIDNKSTVFEPKISTYPLASLSSFDRNFSFLSSFQPSNGFNFTGENEAFETPICNTITMTSPLQIPTASSFMDSCSNWNWDELTTFISTDLRQEWDESQL